MPLKITEHLPIHLKELEPEIVEFKSTEELLGLDFVKGHSNQLGFYRYSINRTSGNSRAPLLAEYINGEKWLVIGFLDGDIESIDLPSWERSLLEKSFK